MICSKACGIWTVSRNDGKQMYVDCKPPVSSARAQWHRSRIKAFPDAVTEIESKRKRPTSRTSRLAGLKYHMNRMYPANENALFTSKGSRPHRPSAAGPLQLLLYRISASCLDRYAPVTPVPLSCWLQLPAPTSLTCALMA